MKDNPTAVMFANGSILLGTRGAFPASAAAAAAPGGKNGGVALFRAASWRGPYAMSSPSVLPCGSACNVEDPFLWRTPRGFHLLMHDHQPFPFHKQVRASPHPHPYPLHRIRSMSSGFVNADIFLCRPSPTPSRQTPAAGQAGSGAGVRPATARACASTTAPHMSSAGTVAEVP
jgi:hypothetical protein